MSTIIELKNVSKTYEMGAEPVHALKEVSLTINAGEYGAIMGVSGSGKSTLVRNSDIGFIFQQFNLLPQLTALHNVMLPLTYAGMSKSERQGRAEQVQTPSAV